MKHWKYLKYIIRHKWYVFVACQKYRHISFFQAVLHDLSKFHPREWIPYANYFYGPKFTEDDRRRVFNVCGVMLPTPEESRDSFNAAWLRHQHKNPHHWQHWILRNDDGSTVCLEMPLKYAFEMIADWEGAGRAIMGDKANTREWYLKNYERIQLHPKTRILVNEKLGVSSSIAIPPCGGSTIKAGNIAPSS